MIRFTVEMRKSHKTIQLKNYKVEITISYRKMIFERVYKINYCKRVRSLTIQFQ